MKYLHKHALHIHELPQTLEENFTAYQQRRRAQVAAQQQQDREQRQQYEAFLQQQKQKDIAARIRRPKCSADYVLRHNAEANKDRPAGGKCGRLGCCVCGCPALLIVKGELQPKNIRTVSISTAPHPALGTATDANTTIAPSGAAAAKELAGRISSISSTAGRKGSSFNAAQRTESFGHFMRRLSRSSTTSSGSSKSRTSDTHVTINPTQGSVKSVAAVATAVAASAADSTTQTATAGAHSAVSNACISKEPAAGANKQQQQQLQQLPASQGTIDSDTTAETVSDAAVVTAADVVPSSSSSSSAAAAAAAATAAAAGTVVVKQPRTRVAVPQERKQQQQQPQHPAQHGEPKPQAAKPTRPRVAGPQQQQQQQQQVNKVLPDIIATPLPEAEYNEEEMPARDSGSPFHSSSKRARALWRTDEWAADLIDTMIADGVLPPLRRDRKPFAAAWEALSRALWGRTTAQRQHFLLSSRQLLRHDHKPLAAA